MAGRPRTSTRERLERRTVRMPNGCIVFQGYVINSGYATMYDGRTKTKRLVHRIAYELYVGAIPDGLVIDHVAARGCTSRLCVNPEHLEAVTPLVNTHRACPPSPTCAQGHQFTPENTRIRMDDGRPVGRICRRCDADRAAKYREQKEAA